MKIPDLTKEFEKIWCDEDLHRLIEDFDKIHGEQFGDIFFRSAAAYTALTGERQVPVVDPGYTGNYDPFRGFQLYVKIHKWYEGVYGTLSQLKDVFGVRKIMVRGYILTLRIPSVYNGDPSTFIPFEFIPDLSANLKGKLTKEEVDDITSRFIAYYKIGSRLALCSTILRSSNASVLVKTLFLRGKADLDSATSSFSNSDPNPALWSATQGVEKYIKGFLACFDSGLTEELFKNKYGHKLSKLLDAAVVHDAWLEIIRPTIMNNDITTDDRYNSPRHTSRESLVIIDQAYAACDAIAQLVIKKYREEEKASNKAVQTEPVT